MTVRHPPPSVDTRSRTAGHRLGLLLAVLLLGHLIPLFVLGRGATGLDWNTMAARWASVPWRIWDLLLVWVAAGYATLLGWRWTRARSGRLTIGICCAALILAAVAAGTFAILTIDLDLG